MTTLESRLNDFATRTGVEFKALRTLINGNLPDLSALTTLAKASLVGAVNEIKASLDVTSQALAALVNDASSDAAHVWSASKTNSAINAAITSLLGGADAAYTTLKQIETFLQSEGAQISTLLTNLGLCIRVDTAQTFTAAQQLQARANLDVYGKADIGDPNTNLVAIFETALA